MAGGIPPRLTPGDLGTILTGNSVGKGQGTGEKILIHRPVIPRNIPVRHAEQGLVDRANRADPVDARRPHLFGPGRGALHLHSVLGSVCAIREPDMKKPPRDSTAAAYSFWQEVGQPATLASKSSFKPSLAGSSPNQTDHSALTNSKFVMRSFSSPFKTVVRPLPGR